MWSLAGFAVGALWIVLEFVIYATPPSEPVGQIVGVIAAFTCPPLLFADVLLAPVLNAAVYALVGASWPRSHSSRAARFVASALPAGVVVTLFNWWPYWLTRGGHRWDGFEVMGFPFKFWGRGGFVNAADFRLLAFLADVAFGVAFCVACGYAVVSVPRAQAEREAARNAVSRWVVGSALLLAFAGLSIWSGRRGYDAFEVVRQFPAFSVTEVAKPYYRAAIFNVAVCVFTVLGGCAAVAILRHRWWGWLSLAMLLSVAGLGLTLYRLNVSPRYGALDFALAPVGWPLVIAVSGLAVAAWRRVAADRARTEPTGRVGPEGPAELPEA